jgi:hypothetical protein
MTSICKIEEKEKTRNSKNTKDRFVMKIGTVPQDHQVHIILKYVTTLIGANRDEILTLPSSVMPPHGLRSPDSSIPIHCTVRCLSSLDALSSSIPWKVLEKESHEAKILFDIKRLDQDLVVKISSERGLEPIGIVEESPNSQGLFLAFTAEPTTPSYPEIIFVLDQSGSMTGSKIEAVRTAMQLLLRCLPSNCFFNGKSVFILY